MVLEAVAGAIDSVVNFLISSFGLAGLFVASIVGNATIFFPAPIAVIVFGLGAIAAEKGLGLGFVILVGIVAGAGAAIGELSGYFVGYLGHQGVRNFSAAINRDALEQIEKRLRKRGNWVIFLGSLSPLPFDIFGLAAGVLRMDLRGFFFATLAGKIIRDIAICLGGYYGAEIVRTFFLA